MPSRTALLVGATGLVGGHTLAQLLATPDYGRITVLVRRPMGRHDPRLKEQVIDYETLEARPDSDFAADDVYCCLGTTIKVAGSQEAFRRVDHDHVLTVGRRARAAGAERFALVSSVGAGATSRSFYLRVKGETERDLQDLGFGCLELFRPSFLVGERSQRRAGEAVGIAVTRGLSALMVGRLRSYRPIEAGQVAAAMVAAMLQGAPGVRVRNHDDILALAQA
jgi:uncharacterized protein YbjT (DUF2867 family)